MKLSSAYDAVWAVALGMSSRLFFSLPYFHYVTWYVLFRSVFIAFIFFWNGSSFCTHFPDQIRYAVGKFQL